MTWQVRDGILHINGEIDLYEAKAFEQVASRYIRETDAPHLDLCGVEFIDSAGLAALLSLVRQAKSENKTLRAHVGGVPRRVLQITGIDRMLALEN